MKTFLEYVAEDILRKYSTDLARTAVVFPNKRASLFLNEALARQAGRPLWSPAYITISELFRRHSTLQVADPIKLVCDLHKTYTEVTGFNERLREGELSSGMTLDHFYGWGQLLITDFDDLDKNMAPADQVFANLGNIHEFDDVSYLSDEQKAIIRKFFSNFTDNHNTLLKERFLRLWSNMGNIYHAFNQRLTEQGLAYEGALYRQVADDPQLDFQYDRYLFVGFNLLQVVEQRLFARLKAEGKAFFYWDFDHYYMKTEAGHFIGQYLSQFPNELPIDDDALYRNFQRPKTISLVSAATEDIQARYVNQWLVETTDNYTDATQGGQSNQAETATQGGRSNQAGTVTQDSQQVSQRIQAGRRTAIVLCNEGLLQTVVHCLPDAVQHVNITTGYPLAQAPIASLVLRLLRNHSLQQVISRVKELAKEPDTANDPFNAEACFRTYTLLNRLQTLIDAGDLTVDSLTLGRLTTQLFQQATIPFHGEPVVGLQIMGVLETRNLDFDHVLLLSTNEGNLPRGITDSSFIPYSLRRAFGLTTADHKAAIYAYYFNRLLSRAQDVTIVYNNATTDGQSAEMSRFVLQLLVEDGHHTIVRRTLQAGQSLSALRQPSSFVKTPAVLNALREQFSTKPLSPTAINRYMRCPLRFYYCYVEGLREPDDTEEGVIDNRQFGNIFHKAAQLLYERLMQQTSHVQASDSIIQQTVQATSLQQGNHILASDLEALLKQRVDIERAVDESFQREFHGNVPTGGLAVINREVIIHYLRQLVEVDRQLAPFTILKLEEDVLQPIALSTLGITTTLGGRVDRIDLISRANGSQQIRVIDYKTSAGRLHPLKCVDDIFDDDHLSGHSDYYLQTLLYARIFSRKVKDTPVAPALLFIQHAGTDEFNPILKFGSSYIDDIATPDGDRFVHLLMEKINEIFNPELPFTPTTDADRCRTCPYVQLCKG